MNSPEPQRSAKVFLFRENNLLLLYQPTHNAYDVPGGSIEPGETTQQAVIRETQEETGFTIDDIIKLPCEVRFRHPRSGAEIQMEMYRATTRQEEPTLSEHTQYLWLPPKDAFGHSLLDSIREALEYCENNKLLYQENH